MTSIRTILIIAWLTVGAFLWLEWTKEQNAPADAPGVEASATVDEDALRRPVCPPRATPAPACRGHPAPRRRWPPRRRPLRAPRRGWS